MYFSQIRFILKDERNISFEEVVISLENGDILDIITNPSSNHKEQKCYVLDIRDYIYLVPFVESEDEIFLKTIFPSRKHKKFYLRKRSQNGKR